MKIYTKTGDKGETSLLSGNRVPKFHLRLETYGTIDELNSFIGLLRGQEIAQNDKNMLVKIQNLLFSIGSELALDENKHNINIPKITEPDITDLEKEMDKIDALLPPLKNFVLPGGNTANGLCHVCRSISRRAERLVVKLSMEADLDILIIKYLNRLSDYFFMLSRKIAFDTNLEVLIWK